MSEHEKINYVEFPARDLQATKTFFTNALGWDFEDFGPDYCAFSNQGIDGGFFRSEKSSSAENGAVNRSLHRRDRIYAYRLSRR